MKVLIPVVVILLLISCKSKTDQASSTPTVTTKQLNYSIIDTFPHDTSSYTQGLIIYKGQLYEGTGLEGRSKLMKVDLATGKHLQTVNLADSIFGEGITILHDTVYQLTWQNRIVYMYSLKDFRRLKEFPIFTEGWGITTDGRELIVSDGSSNLNFYEPGTFKRIRTVSINDNGEFVNNLNELEYIDGYVYGNKYQSDLILKINPQTGIVEGRIDFSALGNAVRAKYPFVDYFNGIAYDADNKKIFVTGKLWPQIYEVRF